MVITMEDQTIKNKKTKRLKPLNKYINLLGLLCQRIFSCSSKKYGFIMPPKFVYLCCLSLSYINLIKANNLLLLDLFNIKTLGL